MQQTILIIYRLSMSLKNKINKILRKFNIELHGLGYLQALGKNEFKNSENSFYLKVFNSNIKELRIFDVGANQGITISNFLTLFPNAYIHAFEPYELYSLELIEKFKINPKVNINAIGISDQIGEQIFNINKSIDTSSLLNSKKTGLNSDEQVKTLNKIKVQLTTIDDFMKNNNIEQINILKLDIQGSELNALVGAKIGLENKKIDIIFTEAYFIQQYENQPLFVDIVNYLSRFGYVIQDIYNPIYGMSKLAWCDVMFIRGDLKL
jgi:FkbM family methyltransferase